MERLITFAGHRDPFVLTPNREIVRDGPVRGGGLDVELLDAQIHGPTDYESILTSLRDLLHERLPGWSSDNLYVSVASGTQISLLRVVVDLSGVSPDGVSNDPSKVVERFGCGSSDR